MRKLLTLATVSLLALSLSYNDTEAKYGGRSGGPTGGHTGPGTAQAYGKKKVSPPTESGGSSSLTLLQQVIDGTYPGLSDPTPMTAGEWREIPNTAPSVGDSDEIINGYSGATYDTDRQRLIFVGAGHDDHYHQVIAFDLPTLTWMELVPETGPGGGAAFCSGTIPYNLPVQGPPATHTYDGVEYFDGNMWMLGGQGGENPLTGTGFDPVLGSSPLDCYIDNLNYWSLADGSTSGTWTRHSITGAFADVWATAINPKTGYLTFVGEHDFNSTHYIASLNKSDVLVYNHSMVGGYPAPANQLVACNDTLLLTGESSSPALTDVRLLLDNSTHSLTSVSTDWPTGMSGAYFRQGGIECDVSTGKVVAWPDRPDDGNTSDVWTFDPETNTWAKIAGDATIKPPEPVVAIYTKFKYIPAVNAFVAMPIATPTGGSLPLTGSNVWVYKLTTNPTTQTWAQRIAASGVVYYEGFDDATTITRHGETDAHGRGCRKSREDDNWHCVQDTNIKAAGVSSMRMDYGQAWDAIWTWKSGDGLYIGDTDTGAEFGQGTTYYMQMQIRRDAITASSSGKVMDMSNAASCGDPELTINTSTYGITDEDIDRYKPFVVGYSGCGLYGWRTDTSYNHITTSPYMLQQGTNSTTGHNCSNLPGSLSGFTKDCFWLPPDTWVTIYCQIDIGTWNTSSTTLQCWESIAGSAYKQFIHVNNFLLESSGGESTKVDRYYLGLYNPGEWSDCTTPPVPPFEEGELPFCHPPQGESGSIWYDSIIFSTQPIAVPAME